MAGVKEIVADKRKLTKYIVIAVISLICLILYFVVTYRLVLRTDLDSDYANLVLEANDIVNGNIFLTGWNQTGVSFLLTDLLYFIIGAIVFGATKSAYILAMVVMLTCTMFTAFFLTDFKNIKNNVLYFALTAFPSVSIVCLLRAHTGGYIWTFVMLIILNRCIKKNHISWGAGIGMGLLTAMCAMSDAASLVFGAGSLLIICVYKLIFDRECIKKFYAALLGFIMGGSILGFLMDKVYYLIGGANKNAFLENKSFIEVEDILSNFYTYLDSIFTLGNADIFGNSLFDLDTIIACMYVPFIFVGFWLVCRNIKMFLKNKNQDIVSVVLSVGFCIVSFTFIFTTVGIDIFSSRYFATLPFFFAVLLCRYIKNNGIFEKCAFTSVIKWKYVLMAVSILLVIGGFTEYRRNTSEGEYVLEQENFANFLKVRGLTNGYANYWDSSIVTVASNGEVQLSQIQISGSDAQQQNWFCKNDWYEEPANYVAVYDPEKDDYGVTPDNVYLAFGEPSEILTYGGFLVYKYDYDISTKLTKIYE